MDAGIGIELLAFTHLDGVIVAGQDGAGTRRIEPDFARNTHQDLVVRRVFAIGEIGLEQRLFKRTLTLDAFQFSPMQQTVRVEGVVDALALASTESEPHGFTTQTDRLT